MPTYVYRNVTSNYTKVFEGITVGPQGVSYATDNLTLNKYVPGLLDRWVDGEWSVTNLVIPDPIPTTNQETQDHLAAHLETGTPYTIVNNLTPVGIVGVAATFTTLTPADSVASTGFLQLSSAGTHGLTTGTAHANKYVYITWTGGTGVSGLFPIKTVDDANIITLNTSSVGFAGMGTPVVSLVTERIPLVTNSIAAGILNANSSLIVEAIWSHTSSANNKTISLDFGGTTFGTYVTPTTVASTIYHKEIKNTSLTTQISSSLISAGPGSSGALVTGAVNTGLAKSLVLYGALATANEVLQLETYKCKVEF